MSLIVVVVMAFPLVRFSVFPIPLTLRLV
jgi:hypothetical protein